MSDTEKILEEHRKMVALTGNLSDFQLKNLKMWPNIVIDDKFIESVEIKYDFTRINEEDEEELHAGKVVYNFSFKEKLPYPKEELKNRLNHLVKWTRSLFWEDTDVEMQKKGRKWQSWSK